MDEILTSDEIAVLQWFEDNYIGPVARNGRKRASPYPVEVWNVYGRVLNDQDRTNNHSEAAHNKLGYELGVKHPTIWKFIDGLRIIQKSRDQIYERALCGMPAPKKLKRYLDADVRIKKLVTRIVQ